ncbi:MAG: hypothetical protein IJ611_03490 [Bacteroidales bacterium]|nr:hypothetical protein [Bacteroidales bacterium]MBR1489752.1 hypothetical protein [Bacteroidales bacterium]
MEKMILYKEWLKTRWVLAGIALVMAGVAAYGFLNLAKVVEFRGAEILWTTLIAKDTVLLEAFRYLPAVAGGLLALAQMVPEVQQKRLKLTLHLPYPEGKMLLVIGGYGMAALTLLFALHAGLSALVLGRWLVPELIGRILRTMLVWYLAGWAVYLWTSAICLEPTWRRRVLLAVLLACLLWLLFLSAVPEAYNGFLPVLVVYVLLSALLIRGSVARFKEGYQD